MSSPAFTLPREGGTDSSAKRWENYARALREDFVYHLAKMAQALAYEGREALDQLGDVEYYLWFIETWGTHEDMENAGIEQEEEE